MAGLVWVSDLGFKGLRKRLLISRPDFAAVSKAFFECVLSKGFAVGRERALPGVFWAVDGFCAWRGLWRVRACEGVRAG